MDILPKLKDIRGKVRQLLKSIAIVLVAFIVYFIVILIEYIRGEEIVIIFVMGVQERRAGKGKWSLVGEGEWN